MNKINRNFKIFTMLLSLSISNCLCFSSKEYKNYNIEKIDGIIRSKDRKREFRIRNSKKAKRNFLRNTFAITGVSVLGIGSVYLGRKCLNKNKTVKNGDVFRIDEKNIKEREVNGVKLSVSDQIWIAKNMILFEWENPLCWHNAFMQFLACPDVRQFAYLSDKSQSRYKSNKIMTMINWINKELSKPYSGDCLERCVKVPTGIRRAQDGAEKFLKSGDGCCVNFEYGGDMFDNYSPEFMVNYLPFDIYENGELCDCLKSLEQEDQNFILNTYLQLKGKHIGPDRTKRIRKLHGLIEGERNERLFNENWFDYISKYNYYPTFFQICHAEYENTQHICACYAVYNEAKEIKYFLWADSFSCEKFIVLSKEEGLKKLKAQKVLWINFVRGDIVGKYFTPK